MSKATTIFRNFYLRKEKFNSEQSKFKNLRSEISKTSNLSTNAQIDLNIKQLKSLGCQLQTNYRHQDFKQIRY